VSQKLLVRWAMGVVIDNAHGPADQKFLRRFFQKAAASLDIISGYVFHSRENISIHLEKNKT
jgi:hypothetical protein